MKYFPQKIFDIPSMTLLKVFI